MDKEQLNLLLKKYLDDSINSVELTELTELLSKARDKDLTHALEKEWENEDPNHSVFNEAEMNEMTDEILSDSITKSDQSFQVHSWTKIAAVFCLLLVLSGSLFYILKKSNKNAYDLTEIRAPHPGTSRATLELADGQIINLETANNGLLGNQGTVKIIKTKKGQINYQKGENKSHKVQYNTVSTPRGGQYRLILPDSTIAVLNAASSIRFPVNFEPHRRNVEITGEVYFEVSKDKHRPFEVSSGNMQVRVYGTHFIVSAYPDEKDSKCTLFEGSVRVKSPQYSLLLKPGEQAILKNSKKLERAKNVNLNQEMGWVKGVFFFDHANIQEIMRQISRWYNVKIEYTGNMSDRTYSGIVSRNSPIANVLRIMEGSDLHFLVENKKIIVKK